MVRTRSPIAQKKEPDNTSSGCDIHELFEMLYGVFVLAGAAGAFVLAEFEPLLSLQPLTTAQIARPNSTTKDSFFIGMGKLYWFPKKHK